MDAVRDSWSDERRELQEEFRLLREEMHRGFAGSQRILRIGGGIIAALIGVIATQL